MLYVAPHKAAAAVPNARSGEVRETGMRLSRARNGWPGGPEIILKAPKEGRAWEDCLPLVISARGVLRRQAALSIRRGMKTELSSARKDCKIALPSLMDFHIIPAQGWIGFGSPGNRICVTV